MPAGRPSEYDPEIAADICALVSTTTLSLEKICNSQERFPGLQTFYRWMLAHPELREEYAHAKEQGLEILADELTAIADEICPSEIVTLKGDGSREVKIVDAVEHRRLRIDTRKWLLSKLAPKKYGDQTKLVGAEDGPLQIVVKSILGGQ